MPQIETDEGALPIAARPEPEGATHSTAIDALLEVKPLDREGELAKQLSEVLRRPVKRASPTHATPTEPPADRTEAASEAFAATPPPEVMDSSARQLRRMHVTRPADAHRPSTRDAISGPDTPDDDGSEEPDRAALPPRASAWIEAARRERGRAILRGAAGWTISVATSVAIIGVAAWILLGRPTDLEALLEQARQVLDLS